MKNHIRLMLNSQRPSLALNLGWQVGWNARWLASVLTIAALGAMSGLAHAGFNKCVGADGSVSYQQTPCPQQAKVETDSVSMLGTGQVSALVRIQRGCADLAEAARPFGGNTKSEIRACEEKLQLVCPNANSASTDAQCRSALAELNREVTVAKAEALAENNRSQRASLTTRGSNTQQTKLSDVNVSCPEAAGVMATDRHGPAEVRARCQKDMDEKCAAGQRSDSCLLFKNKLAMTIDGKRRENQMKADGTWGKRKNDVVGNVNEFWTACMGRAQFADDAATFIKRKADCDELAPK